MSDIAVPYRSSELLPPARSTAASGPLGLWATIVWARAAYPALWSPVLIDAMLHAVWGPGVTLPAVIAPIGHIAAGAVVMAAVWRHRQSLREYLAMSPIGWG